MQSYSTLKLSGLLEPIVLEDISIKQTYNEHAVIKIEGIAPLTLVEHCIQGKLENILICLKSESIDKAKDPEVIFYGNILKASIRHTGDIYRIMLDGISRSYLLDRQRENRSFQQIEQTFSDVIDTVLDGTECTYINSDEEQNKPIEKFTLQWNETCWMFIKRLVSRHNIGLIPDIKGESISFYIGLPVNGKEHVLPENQPYECFRLSAEVRELIENQRISDVSESNFLYYFIPNQLKCYNLGDRVHFQGLPLRIVKIHSHMDRKDIVLRHDYTCTTEEGCKQPLLYNTQIQGMSLESRVIDRRKDYAKVHLFNIDKAQDVEKASWFRKSEFYTAGMDSGWCAMPELEDQLKLHFPTYEENDCYLMNSKQVSYEEKIYPRINAATKKATNPKIPEKGSDKTPSTIPGSKFLIAPNGQSMLLDDGMICFSTCGGTSTFVLSSSGIQMNTDDDINMVAKKSISFGEPSKVEGNPAKELNFFSKQNVIVICDDSSIVLNHETGTANFIAVEIQLLPV